MTIIVLSQFFVVNKCSLIPQLHLQKHWYGGYNCYLKSWNCYSIWHLIVRGSWSFWKCNSHKSSEYWTTIKKFIYILVWEFRHIYIFGTVRPWFFILCLLRFFNSNISYKLLESGFIIFCISWLSFNFKDAN